MREPARFGLARSARVCDLGTQVSELELKFRARWNQCNVVAPGKYGLNHPQIARLYDVGAHEGTQYPVMGI